MGIALESAWGKIVKGDSLEVMATLATGSVDLIMTSPPFALTRKKAYGNAPENEYVRGCVPSLVNSTAYSQITGAS